ncbi:hypothetical protein KAH81_07085 [bacterium]|nr:hypothetical protein [bacterium]
MELVGLVLNAVDGTKILADVSRKKSYFREDLEKLLSKLDDTVLEEIFEEIEYNEEAEKGREYRLPDDIADREKLLGKIEEQLKTLNDAGAKQLNETDGDARMIKTESGNKFCYNAQASVGDKRGIVVGADVTIEQNDTHQLGPIRF